MTTPKNPEIEKLKASVARLEKIAASLHLRIQLLEKENKRLRGSLGRTNDQLGTFERTTSKALKGR